MRIFVGSNFEFCTISLIVMLNIKVLKKNFFYQATIGGDTIIRLGLRLRRIEFSLV
jgi:hypothetical protein